LLYSRNIATEQAMQKVGVQTVIDLARSLGISSPLSDDLGTAIGESPVTMLEQATGFSALANGGFRVTPHAIVSVTDAKGRTLLSQPAQAAPRVISGAAVCQVNGILQRYPQTWNLGFNRAVDGKSGTTDSYKDAWFMAYSPQWVVATWVGRMGPNGSEGAMDQVFGTTMARYLAVPFVNGLPASGTSPACGLPSEGHGGGGGGQGHGHGKHGDGGGDGGGGKGGDGGGGGGD
jgi:membrane peptidoglycan carboxypeptidase